MALFTIQEFADYIEQTVFDARVTLLRDLVTGLIADAVGDTWDENTASVTAKAVAMDAVARAYSNPLHLESQTRAIDDYTTTDRWSASSVGLFLTDDELATINGLYGTSKTAFTIRPQYEAPSSPIESWA